jgi:hypothetical protein
MLATAALSFSCIAGSVRLFMSMPFIASAYSSSPETSDFQSSRIALGTVEVNESSDDIIELRSTEELVDADAIDDSKFAESSSVLLNKSAQLLESPPSGFAVVAEDDSEPFDEPPHAAPTNMRPAIRSAAKAARFVVLRMSFPPRGFGDLLNVRKNSRQTTA